MIEILSFEKDLFNNFLLEKHKIVSNTYVTSLRLANELLVTDLPIQQKKALIRIFNFLAFVDIYSDEKGILTISKKILEKYLTRTHYVKYMKILSKLNVIHKIKTNGEYYKFGDKNAHATKYKLHRDYVRDTDLAIVILENKNRKQKNFVCEIENLNERYRETIKTIELDIPKAIKAEVINWKEKKLSMDNLRKRISRILSTLRDRKISKGQKVERIYHSFSNLSRISREHFKVNFYDIDIVNSQPLLLVAYLKKNNFKIDKAYQNDCESGEFYEKFYCLSKLNDEDEKRNKVKRSLYSSVYFAFYNRNKFNKRFKELYPKTWGSLMLIDKTKISLASRLQNLEASLFNALTPKLSKYYFTLFDAVYFTNSVDQILLKKQIKKFFNELNIEVKIK